MRSYNLVVVVGSKSAINTFNFSFSNFNYFNLKINMKISPNSKKLLKLFLALLAVLFALYVFDLMKYKTRFNELKNDEVIELEIQVENLQNKVDEITGQLEHNENAIKNANNQINLYKTKCPNCTYHLSGNYEN